MNILKSLLVGLAISATLNADPFPQGRLDLQLFGNFYPQIKEEVAQEFSLQDDGRTRRNTREYGYSFFNMEQGDFSQTPIPAFYQELGALICQSLGDEPVEFDNIILSFYDKGFNLEPHVDVNADNTNYNFYFDEKVYGIVIEPDATGHLYFVQWDDNTLAPLDLPPFYSLEERIGTIYCLQGEFRNTLLHAVAPISRQRISITFRTVQIKPGNAS